jgi:VIT1/CCC1 family predicted Fe2+/Mn2+ transporter
MAEDPGESWFHEMQSAWLYRQVAAVETDPPKVRLFESLAVAAEEQAETWARLAQLGPAAAAFRPSTRARISAALVRRFGVRPMRAVLVALKMRGLSIYDSPALDGHAMPTRVEQVGARHRGGGGNLRAAVFGINDGLVSNASLIMGVAGAGVGPGGVLTTGIAGLLAGALSMAAGEYVSVRSQREMYEYQIGLEREELAEYPEEEAEELALIYSARGMEIERARQVANDLLKDPEHALDTLAREELGLNPDDLGSPWGAASSSFIAFAAGAIVPLLPFVIPFGGAGAIQVAIGLTAATLFGVGMALSLFTGRNAVAGGLRMVAIGGGAGLITWFIGRMIGGGLI